MKLSNNNKHQHQINLSAALHRQSYWTKISKHVINRITKYFTNSHTFPWHHLQNTG